MAAKIAIAPGSAIAAHNIDLSFRLSDSVGEITQQIKQPRIDMVDGPGAMVAQEMFELLNGLGHILVAHAIDNVNPLIGMRVIKAQPMGFAVVRRRAAY